MEQRIGSTIRIAEKIKLFSGPGTRRSPRYDISDIPWIRGVSSTSGSKLRVVNVSRGGTLLETRDTLAPRTRIQLSLETAEGVIQLTGRDLFPNPIQDRDSAAVAAAFLEAVVYVASQDATRPATLLNDW